MRLSPAMRRSVAVSLDTQLLPGTRVCWKRPFGDGELGTVRDVSLSFDGKGLELAGVFVAWDDPELPADSFCVDELHMLEILP